MLMNAIGGLLPFAVAVALSPIPIIAVVLMLGTPKARRNGPAFAVGWVAGLVIISVVVLALTNGSSDPDSSAATGVNWVKLALGIVFLVLAAKQWRTRPRAGEEPEMPAWMATVDGFTPAKSLVFGAALSGANPKNLVLTAAAAASIAEAGLTGGEDAIAIAVFVVLASLTVVGSVVFYLVAGERAAGPLASMKVFMTAHSNVIMMVLLLVLGAKLIGDGLGGVAT